MDSTIVYPGIPQPQARPRFSRAGGVAYTPAKTRREQQNLRAFLIEKWRQEPLQGAVSLNLEFRMPVPKSWAGWRLEAWENGHEAFQAHTSRPDLDNLIKLVKDAAKGVLWGDDSQVWLVSAHKVYARHGATLISLYETPPRPTRKADLCG